MSPKSDPKPSTPPVETGEETTGAPYPDTPDADADPAEEVRDHGEPGAGNFA